MGFPVHHTSQYQWGIQDFPQRGSANQLFDQFFFRKMHENEETLVRGGVFLPPAPDPQMSTEQTRMFTPTYKTFVQERMRSDQIIFVNFVFIIPEFSACCDAVHFLKVIEFKKKLKTSKYERKNAMS